MRSQPTNLERDIRLYMFLRLLMLFSVLVSTATYQMSGTFATEVVIKTYFVTFFTFLVTTGFIFLYEKARNVKYFLSSQIAYDVLFTTVLIFYSGPFDSIYTVFYLFNIIFAAIIFRGRGALLTALASSALYTMVTVLNSENLSGEKSFSMLTALTAYVAIALLSGQLVEELSKSRQKISRLEQLSEEIVNSLDTGLLGIDSEYHVQKINRTAQTLLGIQDVNTIIGRSVAEVLPVIGEVFGSQVRDIRVHGLTKRMLINNVALPENHRMILIRDLTEVLELEDKVRRQERLAGVGRLAAGVAHEIRNPIASISGAAQLLSEASTDQDENRRLTQIIIRESERVDRLVAQLLRFAKPTIIKRESVDFSEIVNECLEAVKARPELQNVKVDFNVQIEKSLMINGNKDELREVVTNLIVNAVQALIESQSASEKLLRLEVKKVDKHIELVVADNGPGIPKEFCGRIFDPFFTTRPNGTGLGLAQVHKIVRDHEGHIDLETEEGKGTALKIRLPG